MLRRLGIRRIKHLQDFNGLNPHEKGGSCENDSGANADFASIYSRGHFGVSKVNCPGGYDANDLEASHDGEITLGESEDVAVCGDLDRVGGEEELDSRDDDEDDEGDNSKHVNVDDEVEWVSSTRGDLRE